jgi:hypothetical protein
MVDAFLGSDAAVGIGAVQERGQESAQLLAVVLTLFVDLWKTLPKVDQPDLQQTLVWLARMRDELGKVVDLSNDQPPSGDAPT